MARASMVLFVWWAARQLWKEGWRYAWVEGGALCAMTSGTVQTLLSSVASSDTPEMVNVVYQVTYLPHFLPRHLFDL